MSYTQSVWSAHIHLHLVVMSAAHKQETAAYEWEQTLHLSLGIYLWSIFIHWRTRHGRIDLVFYLKLFNRLSNSVTHIYSYIHRTFLFLYLPQEKVNKQTKNTQEKHIYSHSGCYPSHLGKKSPQCLKKRIPLILIIFI